MSQRGQCRSCGETVWWAISDTSGKPLPLDDEVVPDGNLAVRRDPDTNDLRARPRPASDPRGWALRPGEKGGRSHFATCEHASEHRRPKGTPDGHDRSP